MALIALELKTFIYIQSVWLVSFHMVKPMAYESVGKVNTLFNSSHTNYILMATISPLIVFFLLWAFPNFSPSWPTNRFLPLLGWFSIIDSEGKVLSFLLQKSNSLLKHFLQKHFAVWNLDTGKKETRHMFGLS